MSVLELSERTRGIADRLAPYARDVLERAAREAHRLHAEEVSSEHFLYALLLDEEAGATRLVLHAFADPATIAQEVLALCPGILVVASSRSLPFSVRSVDVLEEARSDAHRAGAPKVEPEHLLASSFRALDEPQQSALREAGYDLQPVPPRAEGEVLPREGPLLRHYSEAARRALGLACRAAGQLERDAISPAHVVLAALEADSALAQRASCSPSRARMVLGSHDVDLTPLGSRRLPLAPDLTSLLEGVEPGAETAAVLTRLLAGGTEELRLLLIQQKITLALAERSGGSFPDPEVPPAAP